jgi:DNA-binding YbaB/EbfC family protein
MSGLFGQMKDLYKLQKEAKEMQKKMKTIHITGYSDDENVKIVMNGVQEIEEMDIKDEIVDAGRKKELVRAIKEALKDAQRKLQKEMTKDMDIDQIKGMLGA